MNQKKLFRDLHEKAAKYYQSQFSHDHQNIPNMPSLQRNHKKQKELQQQWEQLGQTLSTLNEERNLETRTEEQMRLQARIDKIQNKRNQVEQELNVLELQLTRDGQVFSQYNKKDLRFDKAVPIEAERYKLEYLYHIICADETKGMKIFLSIAEDLMNFLLYNLLKGLLIDANSYQLEYPISQCWKRYYEVRLREVEEWSIDVANAYQEIAEDQVVDKEIQDSGLMHYLI